MAKDGPRIHSCSCHLKALPKPSLLPRLPPPPIRAGSDLLVPPSEGGLANSPAGTEMLQWWQGKG